jgi:hypothetical protein
MEVRNRRRLGLHGIPSAFPSRGIGTEIVGIEQMRIRFQQSGGYAGLIKGCELDTESLPPEEAMVIHSLVKKSNIKGNQKFITRDARDLRTYSITVEKNEESNSISFDDMTVPEGVQELLSFLESRAKPRTAK